MSGNIRTTALLAHPWASRRRKIGLTQEQVASRLSVTRHMLIRLEQGLFPYPSAHILRDASAVFETSEAELLAEYRKYIHDSRDIFARKYKNFSLLADYDGLVHPLVHWRELQGLSRIGFAKGFCLTQAPLNNYEANRHMQRNLPVPLKEALDQVGWSSEPLTAAVAAWRIKWH